MNLYWLEQAAADVPIRNDWLSPWEIARLGSFRFAKRRADWRLGRWTAKQAVAFCLNLESAPHTLTAIEIRPASSGVPEVFVHRARAPVAISLSHRAGRAMCALARADVRVGCDLEVIESHSDAFITDYFNAEEQQLLAGSCPENRNRTVALLWSAKESALKTLHEGLRLDTTTVTVRFEAEWANSGDWGQLQACYGDQMFRGWWEQEDDLVRTVVADVLSNPPIRLPITCVLDQGVSFELPIGARCGRHNISSAS